MFTRRNVLIVVSLSAAIAVGIAAAPADNDKPDYAAIYKIKDEGLNHSQVMETLSYLTDVHGPRLTGSPQLRGAQQWAMDQMKKWGLENVQPHPWTFGRGWKLKHFSAHMTAPSYAPLIAYPKAWTPGFSSAAPVTGPAVRVDITSEADFEKYKGKLKGAYVLTAPARELSTHFTADGKRYTDEQLAELDTQTFPRGGAFAFPGAPPAAGGRGGRGGQAAQPARGGFGNQGLQRAIMAFYLQEGIAAMVDPGRNGDMGTVFVQSGGQQAADAPPVPAQIVVATEHYNRMVRILEKNIPVSMEVDYQAEFTNPDGNDFDITAEIPGGDKKNEVVMVGGHFDSWHTGTGATDNGAGSAVAMEVMRILKQSGLKMRRTVRIGLWTGEEEGLLGSRCYVNDVFASRPGGCGRGGAGGGGGGGGRGGAQPPPTPHQPAYDNFAGYFNIDNGTGKIRGVYLQGNEEVRPIFQAWLAPFKDMGATQLSVRNTGGTDHLSFDGVGLPGFQFIQDEMDYDTRTHHSNMDTWDRVSRNDMMQIAVIEASFVYHTAMREQKLPRKPMPAPRPESGN